ncbi:MAG TPA: hypothetical protein ENI99_09785 [Sedimenticola sp.]|nr:hypothetical protein [Sedimenticola sp.]
MPNKSRARFITSIFILAFSFGVAQAGEHEIGMAGWEFNPAELTITAGETVVWYNDDDTNHDIAFEIEFENAPTLEKPHKVRSTKRYAMTFNQPGIYRYTCKIHRDYDMKGVIIVKEADK